MEKVNLSELEKIANQIVQEHEMNPDQEPQMSPEEVQEAQTGQAPPVQSLSPEELALKQQLDEQVLQDQEAEEEERAAQHEAVDRALLEGAAEEVISEMEDEEIKDLLIDKAANEMIQLGAFSTLIDLSTGDYEGHVKEAATQYLEYMAGSSDQFYEGLDKVASEIYPNSESMDGLFSSNGVHYIFEQLAKAEDFNDLSKVASESDLNSIANIAVNEGDALIAAQEVVTEAYEEALKEIAKEDIKDAIREDEYEEEVGEEELESVASLLLSDGFDKEARNYKRIPKSKRKKKKWLKKQEEAARQQAANAGTSGGGSSSNLPAVVSRPKSNATQNPKKNPKGGNSSFYVGPDGTTTKGKGYEVPKAKPKGPDYYAGPNGEVYKGSAPKYEVGPTRQSGTPATTTSGNSSPVLVSRPESTSSKKGMSSRTKKLIAGGLGAGAVGGAGVAYSRRGKGEDEQEKTASFKAKVAQKAQNLRGRASAMSRGKKVALGATAVGVPTAGAVAHNRSKKRKQAQSAVYQDNSGLESTASLLLSDGFEKQANPIKKGYSAVRNLGRNKKTLSELSSEQDRLIDLMQNKGKATDLDINQAFQHVSQQKLDLERQVRNGQLLGYGVPGAAAAGGALYAGKRIADSKKNVEPTTAEELLSYEQNPEIY